MMCLRKVLQLETGGSSGRQSGFHRVGTCLAPAHARRLCNPTSSGCQIWTQWLLGSETPFDNAQRRSEMLFLLKYVYTQISPAA